MPISSINTSENLRLNYCWHTSTPFFSTTTRAMTANDMHGLPYCSGGMEKITKMGINVTVAHASNARFAIYKQRVNSNYFDLIYDFGEVSCNAVGTAIATGGPVYLMPHSTYLLVVWFQGSPTVSCTTIGATFCNNSGGCDDVTVHVHPYAVVAYGSWPDPQAMPCNDQNECPRVMIYHAP